VLGQLSCYTGKEITWDQMSASDFYYSPRPEDCRDDMEAPTEPGSDETYPVPVPGQTDFKIERKIAKFSAVAPMAGFVAAEGI